MVYLSFQELNYLRENISFTKKNDIGDWHQSVQNKTQSAYNIEPLTTHQRNAILMAFREWVMAFREWVVSGPILYTDY